MAIANLYDSNNNPFNSISGSLSITGSVAIDSTINIGTVAQGASGSVPWLITGSVTINNPSGGGSGGNVTQGSSGSEYWKITGSVNIPEIVTITGSTTIDNFPVTQSVKIDQSTTLPISVSNFPNIQTITGSVSVNNLTFVSGANLSVFITASNVLPITGTINVNNSMLPVSVSNFPTIQTITGTVLSLPFGVQTVTGTLAITMASNGYGGQVEGRAADSTTAVGNPVLAGGADGSIARSIQVDSLGRIVTAPAGSSNSVTASLATGYITTAATTQVAIRSTAYTEQITNAQRSIVSANAADAAAGTGARTVLVIYYDQNYVGPYSETVTMNGVTPVNMVATNLCFVEQIYVSTAGSGGANAGIISLKATTGGGGATITSIAVGDNRTFMAHHYVPIGKTTYITGLSTGHSGTTVGSGCVFVVKIRPSGSNQVERQVSDFVRLYGQSSTNTRTWGTAIQVSSSTRITVFGTPETTTSTIYRAAMDLYDQ